MCGGVGWTQLQRSAEHSRRPSDDADITTTVCETNQACSALIHDDEPSSLTGKGSGEAVCYAEGYGIKEMFQMCDVTSA